MFITYLCAQKHYKLTRHTNFSYFIFRPQLFCGPKQEKFRFLFREFHIKDKVLDNISKKTNNNFIDFIVHRCSSVQLKCYLMALFDALSLMDVIFLLVPFLQCSRVLLAQLFFDRKQRQKTIWMKYNFNGLRES